MVRLWLVPLGGAALSVLLALGAAAPAQAADASNAPERRGAAERAEPSDDAPGQAPADEGGADRADEPELSPEERAELAREEAAAEEQVDGLARQVESLRSEVERIAGDLMAGTIRLEEGQQELELVQAQAAAARTAADQALAEVAVARARLAAVVSAAYRQPRPSDISLAFAAAPGELSTAVLASAELDHVQGNVADVVEAAAAKDEQARGLVREAERLEADAVTRTADLAAQVVALRTTAEQTQVRLENAATQLREAQAAQEAARIAALDDEARKKALAAAQERSLADVSGGRALCAWTSTAGYANGFLPPEVLCPLTAASGHRLRADAARAFDRMAKAYDLCLTDSYRSYGSQVDVYARKPGLAAVPGTSNHGLGVAVDLCGGVETFGTPAYRWMAANAPRYGWVHPSWAEQGGSRPEPWHWEFVGIPAGR